MTVATVSNEVKRPAFNRQLFLLLLGLGLLGLIAYVPYALTLAGQQLDRAMLGLATIQLGPQLIVLAIQIGLGLLLGSRIGLGAPLLTAWLAGDSRQSAGRVLWRSAMIGALVGAVVLALDIWLLGPAVEVQYQQLGVTLPAAANPPAWQGLLAALYGGINEELLMRLFLLTLIAWLGSKVSRTAAGQPKPAVMWMATLVAGLALGVGHLPQLAALNIPLTTLNAGRILLLNLSGVVFGWLYWKRGLASAMVAHMATDIVLHVIGALILAGMA